LRRASPSNRRARRVARRALVLGGLLAGAAAQAGPPNLLLVTLDTTRADHTSAYGYAHDTTPTLRAVAEAGARFALAYAASSSTLPSHATLMSGLAPIGHGVVKNGQVLPAGVETLAERLRARGFDTAAVVSSFVLDRRFGLDQGFGHWDDALPREQATWRARRWNEFELVGGFDRRANHTTDHAIEWLEHGRRPDRPFFLFVHYFDPHAPYLPPAPFDARFAAHPPATAPGVAHELAAPYDGEIAFTDAELGRLLARLATLGLAERTLVVITADHGEGLGQHGVAAHTVNVYEEAVRVPLVLRWPGRIPAGRVIEGPVDAVDVAPTLLALLEVAAPGAPAAGRSLAGALLRGEALDPEHPVYLRRRPYDEPVRVHGQRVLGELFAVRRGRWKWIEGTRDGTRQLYDLAADPFERANVAGNHAPEAGALAALLARFRAERAVAGAPGGAIPPDVRERLEALGYVE
jgi:arylsulfatase A-like enzyme